MADKTGKQIGNYRLVKLIGKGGFAEVYLGQHVRIASKRAAVKILYLFDVDAKKFQQEAEITEQLAHPHIVRLLEFDLQEGIPFLVLDYASGGSLRNRHPKGSQVALATVIAYLKEIAPALQYAHNRHILHRDIKPDNMLIGRQGELLLSDFGIAELSQTGRTSLEATLLTGGTPYYMAPETFNGRPEKASDQYSLAVVVYEWLCGVVPFNGENFIQLGYQHAHAPVPPLRSINPAISPAVEKVVMKALAKDPRDRYPEVKDFAEDLENASRATLRKEPPLEVPGSTVPPVVRRIPAGLSILLVVLAVLLFAGGGGFIYYTTVYQSNLKHAQATSAAVVQLTGTAHAQATAAVENPYTHSGTLVLTDHLSDNSKGYNWDENTNCAFKDGTYHAIAPNPQYGDYCIADASFDNFAYEVHMQILQGDGGGINFRVTSTSVNQYYELFVYKNGYYELDVTTQTISILASGNSPAIKQGLNQINVIGVVAQGPKITVYINDQQVATANDSTFKSGRIGVEANPFGTDGNPSSSTGHPTEVAYSNVRVWTL
jgi:serine/threonine protein kinase